VRPARREHLPHYQQQSPPPTEGISDPSDLLFYSNPAQIRHCRHQQSGAAQSRETLMTLPILLGQCRKKKSAAAAGKIIINHTLSHIYWKGVGLGFFPAFLCVGIPLCAPRIIT